MPPYTKYTWVDEVLAAAARYNILEDGGSAFKSNMQINLATSVTQAGSSLTASRMNNIESELKALSDALLYKINPSVATNDLTVALTHADGTAPSSTRPLYVRINDTWYSFTAATTYTKTDGTNWHNAGSTELAGNPIDFFLYAIAETGASAGAKIGHSRIPYATTMANFVNTTTNEKYIAGNWTNFNSTDKVQVIGRFRAQLSAGAGYTWSIPSAVVVNYPIFETDSLSWTPTWTNLSVGNGTVTAKYKIIGRRAYCVVGIIWGSTTSISGTVDLTFPITRLQTDTTYLGTVILQDTGTINYSGVCRFISASVLRIYVNNNSGTYETHTNLSSTIPHTWAATDVIATEYQYDI